jgi:hypothetical protein
MVISYWMSVRKREYKYEYTEGERGSKNALSGYLALEEAMNLS